MANLPSDELPSRFDVIVDGTGLVQSIVAAALARNGKAVLHIDRNCYYGEQWAGLMQRELTKWIEDHQRDTSDTTDTTDVPQDPRDSGGDRIPVRTHLHSAVSNVSETVHVHTPPENVDAGDDQSPNEEGRPLISWESLEPLRRRFNYDVMPKVLYCRGALVELLTQSNCARYVEFKAVNRIFTRMNEHIEQVPCSRSDVFSSQVVSMLEKRKMMKFLSFCSEFDKHPEEYEELVATPFAEYLRGKDLTNNLIKYILHSIAMVDATTPTIQGLQATKVFLNSLGRFGNAPFIYPIFGGGELPQAFCRMCAVFGGVYCLNRHISELVVPTDSNKITGIVCSTGQTIECSSVVCSAGIMRHSLDLGSGLSTETVSRAILVTDGPIENTQGMVTVVSIPPCSLDSEQTQPVRILQLEPSTNTAVQGTYLIHMVCTSSGHSAQRDLEQVTRALFNTQGQNDECNREGPRVLCSLYFNLTLYHVTKTNSCRTSGLPTNLYLTSDPDSTMTYERAIEEARMIFEQLCPGDDFLPRPPDPEDIIFDDENQVNEGDPGNQADGEPPSNQVTEEDPDNQGGGELPSNEVTEEDPGNQGGGEPPSNQANDGDPGNEVNEEDPGNQGDENT